MKLELSFPTRVLAFLIVVLFVPAVYVGARWMAQGSIQFTSSIPGAFVVDTVQEVPYEVPTTLTRAAGKRVITLSAPGYISRDVTLTFPTLRLHQRYDFTLVKAAYDEEDPNSLNRVPLGPFLPYTQTGAFTIDFPELDGSYTIHLTGTDVATLKDHQRQALAWIRSHSIDPTKLVIHWDPAIPH